MNTLRHKIRDPKHKLLITYIAVIMAMLFWGFSFIWTKMLLEHLKPVSIITLRLIISVAFLVIVGTIIRKLQRLDLKDIKLIAFVAFLEPFLYFLGETNGLNHVSATASSVLIATIPLLSPFAAWFFYKEKLTILNFVGIVISFFGVALVILRDDNSFNASVEGVLLMGVAVFSAVGYSVVVVKAVQKYNIFTIITYQNLFGVIYFLPVFFIFDFGHIQTVQFSGQILRPLVSLAILASSLAFMLFTYGIKVLGIVKANTIANTIPVFTAIFAYFLLNEQLSWINIAGILVVLSGLLLSQLKKALHIRHRIFFFKKSNDLIE
jgi:drug/metabolite transporter (DMT)-like permease